MTERDTSEAGTTSVTRLADPNDPTGGVPVRILAGFPRDVVALEVTGRVTHEAYETVLIPALERRIEGEGQIKLLYIVGDRFEGFDLGAAWDDMKFGLGHMRSFARVALVSDSDWLRGTTRAFAPLMSCEVRVFQLNELAAARAWITENSPPDDGAAQEVDAERKLPLMEDKQLPEI